MTDPAPVAQVAAVTKTMTDLVLQIASWVLNTLGVALGVVGLLYARAQVKKTKTAEDLVKKVKMDLYHQKASQVFVQMNAASSLLTNSIRSKDWPKAMDSLISLGGQVANALGAFRELIGSKGASDLGLCAADLVQMFESMPISDDEVCTTEVVKSLIVASVNVDLRLQTIAGQMRLAIELENSNERNSDSRSGTPAPSSNTRREADEADNGENRSEEADMEQDTTGV